MSNIYDTANQLEREFRELPAYVNLKAAFKEISEDAEATELFNQFKAVSMEFQHKQMHGLQPSDEEIEAIQTLSQQVMDNGPISRLMESEQQINQLLHDINRIVTQPLQELYEANDTTKEEVDQEVEATEE